MTIIVLLLPVLLVVVTAVYRNRRDSAHLPGTPHGPDADRVRDEMALITRRADW